MEKKLKIGILKETKTPPDRRVTVPPQQAIELLKKFPNVELYVQPSNIRTYKDSEYKELGINLKEDLSNCDILIGVKEIDISTLIANKTYLYFSHTVKKQSYNRKLLQEMMRLGITMVDHECLADENNIRIVAFGRWAGIVGAYNGLIGYGKKHGLYDLKRAYECHDLKELLIEVKKVKLPPIKILITGGGRVANGAIETLAPLNLKNVTPDEFLNNSFDEPVFCQLDPDYYVKRNDGSPFELQHFFKYPEEYSSTFLPYTKVTNLFISCHFWDPKSPVFMTNNDMKANDFKISVIADVSCDIGEPIPSTIRSSSIDNPFYGYNPVTEKEVEPYSNNCITVMAVDNLPGELPRDASVDFGKGLIKNVFPSLFGEDAKGIIERGSILKNGKLTPKFSYLKDYTEEKE
ncbi:MAG: hypothetical protein KAT68_08195 [Bacteroidales bacterium]|nr:hypothetical protein [Bacteroidales bacterium]